LALTFQKHIDRFFKCSPKYCMIWKLSYWVFICLYTQTWDWFYS
jgi:hypothetical protein